MENKNQNVVVKVNDSCYLNKRQVQKAISDGIIIINNGDLKVSYKHLANFVKYNYFHTEPYVDMNKFHHLFEQLSTPFPKTKLIRTGKTLSYEPNYNGDVFLDTDGFLNIPVLAEIEVSEAESQ